MKKSYYILMIATTLLITLLSGCSQEESKPLSQSEFYMDTLCTITIYENKPDILKQSMTMIQDIENRMSNVITASEVSKINEQAGISPVKVSSDTFYVIERALYYSKLSNGNFDVSVAPLVNLWNISTDNPKVPSEKEIDSVLPFINYKNIVLDKEQKTVFLTEKTMKIDLGGIAKGYAADAIASYFEKEDISGAIINLGGNILVFGQKQDGSPWKVGIQDPTTKQESPIAAIPIEKTTAIVTSGIYQRFFEKDGKLYHHILNPTTGYPYDNSLISVTVITDNSTDADALATTLFSLGLEEGLSIVNQLPNRVEAVFIDSENNIYLSNGLKNRFEIIDEKFKVIE